MNWFQQNRFLGSFLAALAVSTLLVLYFLLHEKGAAADQEARLATTINELTRLERSSPFPNEENLEKTKAQTDSYRSSLIALENELKTRTLPIVPMQPNEFQAQLRQSVNAVIENASASKVQLPENFYLGFGEYATSLPNSATTAALLGRELKAIEALANIIVGAHVDALHSLTRVPLVQERPAPTPAPAKTRAARPPLSAKPAAPGVVESDALEFSFSASSAATRKVLNQIATTKEQLFVIRTLVVKNQVDKGPKREAATETTPAPAANAPGTTVKNIPAGPAVSFIVGTEHLTVSTKTEIVNLTLQASKTR